MKKLKNRAMVIFLGLGMLGLGCEEDVNLNCDGYSTQHIETFYVEEFEEVNCHLQNMDLNGKESYQIIKNQGDYEHYISCSGELPAIEFDKYFILAGVYRHHQCAVFDSQQVQFCGNRIFYKIGLLEQICAALTNVSYFVVIDRQYENLPVVFDVEFLN